MTVFPKFQSPTEFTDSVLRTEPKIAVFDCDGTLWSNNSGEDFFYWSMEKKMVAPDIERWARARYEEYRMGHVGEEAMCGEMTTMYHGQRVDKIERAAAEFFPARVKPNYFLEMQSLTK